MLQVTVRAIENAESVSLLLAHGADPAILDNQVYKLYHCMQLADCSNYAVYIAQV
jgi:hypothetical protein